MGADLIRQNMRKEAISAMDDLMTIRGHPPFVKLVDHSVNNHIAIFMIILAGCGINTGGQKRDPIHLFQTMSPLHYSLATMN